MADLSPEQWLARLEKRRATQAATHDIFDAYYRGDHPLPRTAEKLRKEYLRLMQMSRSNWMELVVDARVERMAVDGFRFSGADGKAAADGKADEAAWAIWQRAGLDADQDQVYTDALVGGRGVVMVWPTDADVAITVEDPRAVAVEYAPGSTRRRVAGLKSWREDDNTLRANLWTPDGLYRRFVAQVKKDAGTTLTPRWELLEEPTVNPMGEPPLVEYRCRLRSNGTYRGILAGGPTDIQDRINKTIFDRLLAAEFAAFRQRWVTGYEVPTDEETGQPIEEFHAAVDRLWALDDKDVKFGEFAATDLGPFINSVEADVQHLAAITRTPPHYLLGQSGNMPSGESLKSTETGLVATVRRHQLSLGECHEEVMRLAFRALGDDEKANDLQAETIWRNPESRTEGELVDALIKMAGLGVPAPALWERWGASQKEIGRWRTLAAAQLFERPPPPDEPPPDPVPASG